MMVWILFITWFDGSIQEIYPDNNTKKSCMQSMELYKAFDKAGSAILGGRVHIKYECSKVKHTCDRN